MEKLSAPKSATHKPSNWGGYTFDELAVERAVTLARIELEKERVLIQSDRLRKGNFALSSGFFGRLMSMVNYADIFVIGVKLWRTISPIFRRRR